VQETLNRLVQKIDNGDYDASRGSIRMYMYGIAHFVKLEIKRNHSNLFLHGHDGEFVHQENSDLHQNLEQKQNLEALRNAIQQLSEIQQEVLNLYLDEELTLEAIGSLLKLPSGTVKSHLFRAKEKLKELLENYKEVTK
jgi:RNA polymerase sigma-70 factor (ECF subfamily)